MEEFMINIDAQTMMLVAAVGAILQVAKGIPALEKLKQWFPFIAIGVAYVLSRALGVEDPIMPSIVTGLLASGSYDLLKSPTGALTPAPDDTDTGT